jgi:hypothetical protein
MKIRKQKYFLLLIEQNLTKSANWHVAFSLEQRNAHHLVAVLGWEKQS